MAENTPGNETTPTPEDFTSQITFLRDKGLSVRTADEEKSFLESPKIQINEATSNIYKGIDNDIFRITNVAKETVDGDDGNKRPEKTYTYLQRVLGNQASKFTELSGNFDTQKAELETARTELSALKSSNPENTYSEELKKMQNANALLVSEKDTQIEALQKQHKADSFSHMLDREIAGLKFQKDIKGLDLITEGIKNQVAAMPRRDENGETIFLLADGTRDINIQDGSPRTPKQIFAEKFADYLEVVASQQGTGQAPANGKEQIVVQNSNDVLFILNREGLKLGSKAAMKRTAELKATMPK